MHREDLDLFEKYDLSVIVPTYHRADDLGKLFDSLVIQTVSPKEVVVIDDTPDNSISSKCYDYEYKFKKESI